MNIELGTNPQRPQRPQSRQAVAPQADIYETPEAIVLVAEMPGVRQEKLNITLEQEILTIEGVTEGWSRPGYKLAHEEYGQTDYRRVFTLSTEIDREKISASLRDGVLTLTLPKVAPAKAKKIEINAA